MLLNQKDIDSLLTMKDIVEIVDKTYVGFGKGTTINPTKVNLDLGETAEYPPYQGFMNAMPAFVGWEDIAGIKWAGGFLGRREQGLPYVVGMILLIDPHNGEFKCVMDGALITNLRTGAQAAVSARYIHPGKEITIGLYGAGMQGHMQTLAFAEVFDITELRIYDVIPAAAEKFKEDMKDVVKGEIIICSDPKEASVGDVVVGFTQSKDKYIKDEWIKPGQIVFPMGSYTECADELLLNADKVIVDHIGQCMHRGALAGVVEEGRMKAEDIYATIGEVAVGTKSVGNAANERIICVPIGTGAMDIAVAGCVYRRALEKGMGDYFAFL
ncbi:MAG: ornithine cyclodeaminase family protein [Lachnospiraceae bacterium]